MIKAGIVGITGYTGEELLKILSRHPEAKVAGLYGRSESEARELKDVYPHFTDINMKVEALNAEKITASCDVVFLALPHAVAFSVAPQLLKAGVRVIDLSADFRLNEPDVYEKWYKVSHTGKEHIKDAVYGLCELNAETIKNARLIANPGCYPTSVILACAAGIKKGIIDVENIIIDAKSGISGAGRKPTQEYFEREHPNFRAYNIAGGHRHIPEIEQELKKLSGEDVISTFSPHIMPVERGMLSTVYVCLKKKMDTAEIIAQYKDFYAAKPFVRILDEGVLPGIRNVVNTNCCEIGMKVDERAGRLIIVSAIDNLVKGASGQAVQNMNIMFGLPEISGLI